MLRIENLLSGRAVSRDRTDARRRHTTEVFSVDQVVGVRPGSSDPLHFEPLYSHRHASEAPRGERTVIGNEVPPARR